MEVQGVITVHDLLIDFLANLADPARSTVNDQEHEKGLFLAELRKGLQHIVRRIVAEIGGKLIPNEDNARVGKIVPLDDVGEPLLEAGQRIDKSPALIVENLSDLPGGSKVARHDIFFKLLKRAILFKQAVALIGEDFFPVIGIIVNRLLCRSDQGSFAVIGGGSEFFIQLLTDCAFHGHHQLNATTDIRRLALPNDQKVAFLTNGKETLPVRNEHLVGHELFDRFLAVLKQMLQHDCRIALTGTIGTMKPERTTLVFVLKLHTITDFLYGTLHILMDDVFLPHIRMAAFGINIHHGLIVRAQFNERTVLRHGSVSLSYNQIQDIKRAVLREELDVIQISNKRCADVPIELQGNIL